MAMDIEEREKQQSYYVAKSNKLIQGSRYSMSLLQSKGLLYLISHIKPGDSPNTVYEISISEFCEVCGIENTGGKYISAVERAIQALADKSVWVASPDTDKHLLRWIDQVTVSERRGILLITFHENMMPYLFELKSRYTQYQLKYVLPMQSEYAVRLYEILSSYHALRSTVTFTLDDLKKQLDAENYKRFPDFKNRVLEKAKEDINRYSDIKMQYECITDGSGRKTVIAIKFDILSLSATDEGLRKLHREQVLNPTEKNKKRYRNATADAVLLRLETESMAKRNQQQ